jgi:bifunctional non-homologous end joining protein LigD
VSFQAELAAGHQDRLVYYAFDLLWLNGQDLRKKPQLERKAVLQELFETYEIEAPALYSEHLVGDGQKMFEHAAKLGWEGIVSKQADAPYKSERGEAWLKVKTVQREMFPVIGFVKDPTGVAALYLGKQEGKELRYRARLARVGLAPSPAKAVGSSTPWSVPSPSSRSRLRNQRPPGSNRSSLRMLNTAT